jgi:hypothetical protein
MADGNALTGTRGCPVYCWRFEQGYMFPLLTSFVLAQQSLSAQLPSERSVLADAQTAENSQLFLSDPSVSEPTSVVETPLPAERHRSTAQAIEATKDLDTPATTDLTEALSAQPVAEAASQKVPSAVAPPQSLPATLRELVYPQEVRPLPGTLDAVPVFNSNSPEIIRKSGILLSTFPSAGKRYPRAHLNFPFQGRFDIFSHHTAKTDRPQETPTFYQGILIYNPSQQKTITVNVLQAASYLGTPDAPFVQLPPIVSNDVGRVFSGPGSRTADQVLRGQRQTHWPSRLELKPKQSAMLMNLPIPVPVRTKNNNPIWALPRRPPELGVGAPLQPEVMPPHTPSSNTRTTLAHLYASGPVYVASMAMKAPTGLNGSEGIPSEKDWETLLLTGELLEPRDIQPSPLSSTATRFFYGRVAGVSRGSQWRTQLTDTPESKQLTVPEAGTAFSYGLSLLNRGTFGTAQIQSAPMLARYPDTAYLAHGNYGVHYDLALPLYNPSSEPRTVTIMLQTPIKDNQAEAGLRFWRSPSPSIFFRGTVRVSYTDDDNTLQRQYFHVVQTAGNLGDALVTLTLQPKEQRLVNVDFVYPPDATPPQVLTVKGATMPATFRSTQRP